MNYTKHIHSQFAGLTLAELLREKPTVLLAVTDEGRLALEKLKIYSVFDLGMSEVFDNAAKIVHASETPGSVLRKFGRASQAMVDKDMVTVTKVTELPYEPIQVLIGIGPNNGPELAAHLSVSTIRDLALWPPYLAAKAMVIEAYNPDLDLAPNTEAPDELIPKSGEFGTERHIYASVVMFPGKFQSKPRSLNNHLFDITATPTGNDGFDTVRFGALLSYSQTWFPMRVAKGQLLHSLPLAPGESTRMAVIGWSNKSAAVTRESLTETERLSNTQDRARTISEVANSVANEFQSGSSQSASESATASIGGISAIPFLAGVATGGASVSETAAATHTVSTGSRGITTHLAQNIQDSTQQVTSSVRGQRASVISEVTQSQSENLSTRTITNYNHMHALTIQYYEVVQIYETRIRLEDVERCIFLPIKLIDFHDERNIFKYLPILKSAALDYRARSMLEDLEASGKYYRMNFKFDRLPDAEALFDPLGLRRLTKELAKAKAKMRAKNHVLDHNEFIESGSNLNRIGINPELQLNNIKWRPPNEGLISRVEIEMEDGRRIAVTQENSAATDDPDTVSPAFENQQALSFGAIRSVRLFTRANFGGNAATLQDRFVPFKLAVKLNGESHWLDCSFFIEQQGAFYNDRIFLEIDNPEGFEELGQILMENQLYYSQQIWQRQNPQTLIMQLAPFTIQLDGVSINLVDHITPVPIKMVGNYAVYKFSYENHRVWRQWLYENADRSTVLADQVAIPTGGVFAEAVLGRFNSAEKLDATRFFDWQESLPDEPPKIAPLEAGQRTELFEAPTASAFETNLVKVQAPQKFPDPSGLDAVLKAIATQNLFRNMSGAGDTGTAGANAAEAAADVSVDALAKAGSAFAKSLGTISSSLGLLGSKNGLESLSSLGTLFNAKKAAESKRKKEPEGEGASGNASTGNNAAGVKSTAFSVPEFIDDLLKGTILEQIFGGTSSAETKLPVDTIGQRSTVAAALAHTNGLRSSTVTGPWNGVSRTSMLDRLDLLIKNPKLIDQGAVNLCGPASFFRFWLARDPLAVATYAGVLFETGKASIRNFEVAPSSGSLIDGDYATINNDWNNTRDPSTTAAMPAEADWMLMGALREASNLLIDFKGLPSTLDPSAPTMPHEVESWFRASGLYATVKNEANLFFSKGLDHALALQPGPFRDITLLIDAQLMDRLSIRGTTSPPPAAVTAFYISIIPNHYVSLVSPIQELPGDKIRVQVWSWGSDFVGDVDKEFFEANYYGAVIGEGRGRLA